MSSSVFNVQYWDYLIDYKVHDVVALGGGAGTHPALFGHTPRFFYTKKDHASLSSSPSPYDDLTNWAGYIKINGATMPNFIWTPSYGTSVTSAPKIQEVQFGDGYRQRIREGIDTDLLTVSLSFDTRSVQEASAILHFLKERGATESFVYKPGMPYNTNKKFICKSWTNSINFYNNYSIKATFEEVSI